MVSVAGLSKDPEIKRLAEKVMNLQMFDHIIGSKEQRYKRPTFNPPACIWQIDKSVSFGFIETIVLFFYFQIIRLATARGRAYSEGRIGIKGYEFMYLIKGIGKPPVSQAQSAMLVLALKYGYEMPMALLEVSEISFVEPLCISHFCFLMKQYN